MVGRGGGGVEDILTHICCLPSSPTTPTDSRPFHTIPLLLVALQPTPNPTPPTLRVLGAVRPPLVPLMCLTIAPHPRHLDLLCLRYGYRSLGREWRAEEGKGCGAGARGWGGRGQQQGRQAIANTSIRKQTKDAQRDCRTVGVKVGHRQDRGGFTR